MASDTRLGRDLAGYRIEGVLGRGGMGVVYRGLDPELERQVAIKVVAPELASDLRFRERFHAEMKVAASLEHPHVCPVFRAGEAQGELFVCMRLLDGEDLATKVANAGPLDPTVACALLDQIASALDHAHARSLCHRDVKPENVLLDSTGNAYLTDFGLAGEAFVEGEEGLLAGTLSYLAPERCQGEAAVPASDQYALACLAYALLTGEPPFVREHEAALLYAHLREEPPSLAERGLGRLDPVLRRALAKAPAERYPSCSAFAAELAAALARPDRGGEEAWPEELPRPATHLVGRQRDLTELAALLREPETRLLTLTGPGGTGKTRLALHAAAENASSFPDGVRWVSLAPVRDPAFVLPTIAQAVAVQEQPPIPLLDTLRDALSGRELLLVLDNAEHLLPEVADEVARLRDVRGPTLLVTSRERLDLQAEHLYPVPPLDEREGVALFNDRASYLDPHHDRDDPAVAELCRQLDSLPLAIELAAARVDLFSPEELLSRLAGHLELLKGARDHDPRHQTLKATIEWSYELLSEDEQRILRSLSVFAGGCTLEASETVTGADIDLVHSLIEKSLLRTRDTPLGRRYWMLETIRQYAAEKLDIEGEDEAARGRHAAYYLGLAVESEPALEGPHMAETIAHLAEDTSNLRAALAHAADHEPTLMLHAAAALFRYWLQGGREREGLETLEDALTSATDAPNAVRAAGLTVAGSFAMRAGDIDRSEAWLEEAVDRWRGTDNESGLARALNSRGGLETMRGNLDGARTLFEESVTLSLALEDTAGSARTLNNLAILSLEQGDYESARSELERSLELLRQIGSAFNIAIALVHLARLELVSGDVQLAEAYATEALELAERDGYLHSKADSSYILALSRLDRANAESARSAIETLAETIAEFEYPQGVIHLLEATAEYAATVGAAETSLSLLGAADGEREVLHAERTPTYLVREERLLETIRDANEGIPVDELRAGGSALSRERALELVTSVLNA